MTFAGINHLAILLAAVAAWVAGAVYYTALSRPWMAAQGKTPEQCKAEGAAKSAVAKAAPFVLSFLAEIAMAWVLAGTVGHLGSVTIRTAVISGLFVWGGFILTTVLVNNAFSGRRTLLTAIDAGHWLLVVVVMGVVIGWMGVWPCGVVPGPERSEGARDP